MTTKMNELFISSTLSDNKLTSTINVPKSLKKYFHSFKLFANYNTKLKADKSILNIPLVSTVLPLAWLTGTNLHVEKLDKKYVEAMDAVKTEFNIMFPRGRFSTKILVDDLVENKTLSQGTAMLFTGGLDSTYSLIKNIRLKPRLIRLQGLFSYQLASSHKQHIQLLEKTFSDFAKRESLDISFVQANAVEILNRTKIAHDFHKIIHETTLWLAMQLPLVVLGTTAPLSIGRFNRLLIPATYYPKFDYAKYPYPSQPRIDEKIAWADLRVRHDGYIHRFSKIGLIKEYEKNHELKLSVCNNPLPNRLNCNACEKCYGTIAQLVLEGINPNNCGFDVNRSTFNSMKNLLEKKKFGDYDVDSYWEVLQTRIPDIIETNLCDSRDFFMWLKKLNIESFKKKRNLQRTIFNLLPYTLAKIYDALYCSAYHQSIDPIFTLRKELVKRKLESSQ